MQRYFIFLLMLTIPLLFGNRLNAQCQPDPLCADINEPGEFCPRILPDIVVGEPYEAVLTVIPPSEFEYEGNALELVYMEIDSVVNFPPGISYTANAEKLYADTSYCVLISGTPLAEGKFPLSIYISPYIRHPLTGMLKGPQVLDNTSVAVTVKDITGIDLSQTGKFHIFQNVPNPFRQSTRIGFYTPVNDNFKFKVYNILGELLYAESLQAPSGEHFFRFDGSSLPAGPYLYSISSSSSVITKKLIKARQAF